MCTFVGNFLVLEFRYSCQNDLGVGQCEKMEGVGVVSIGQCDPNSNFAPVLKCAIVKLAVVVRSLNLLRGSDKKK